MGCSIVPYGRTGGGLLNTGDRGGCRTRADQFATGSGFFLEKENTYECIIYTLICLFSYVILFILMGKHKTQRVSFGDTIIESVLDTINASGIIRKRKKLSPRIHSWLYPYIENFIKTKLKYSPMPWIAGIDPPDLINAYFTKIEIGKKIVRTVKEDIVKLNLGVSYTTRDIIDVFIELIHKQNIDHMTFEFQTASKDFKSFWDKYSETI